MVVGHAIVVALFKMLNGSGIVVLAVGLFEKSKGGKKRFILHGERVACSIHPGSTKIGFFCEFDGGNNGYIVTGIISVGIFFAGTYFIELPVGP
jgi:hypothetical protein